ncbi:MAG: hypothetical protein ACTSWW_10590 [Promethearchaeota archaeon]
MVHFDQRQSDTGANFQNSEAKKQIFEEETFLRAKNPAFTAFCGNSFSIPEVTDSHDIRVGTTIAAWISSFNFA